jgi:hypothetical protein
MEGHDQAKQQATLMADIWLGLAKKSRAELIATLCDVNTRTLKQLMRELPVDHVNRVALIEKAEKAKKEEERKAEKDKKEQEKKDKKVAATKAKEDANKKLVRETKKRTYDQNLAFTAFYTNIKKSMQDARDNGDLEHRLFKNDTKTLEEALLDALVEQDMDSNADSDLDGVKLYVQQAMTAQKGVNSLAFVQVLTIGKRFVEVFRYHQAQKETMRFQQKHWTNYVDYLKIVAPGLNPREERNYRRMYELREVFPCIQLISGCSVHEFWLHMRQFRDMLESNDYEALQWRCPVVDQKSEMQFRRKLHYRTVEGDEMVPFAESIVVGRAQAEDNFIEQKTRALQSWKAEDAQEAQPKKRNIGSNDDVGEDVQEEEEEGLDLEEMDEGDDDLDGFIVDDDCIE